MVNKEIAVEIGIPKGFEETKKRVEAAKKRAKATFKEINPIVVKINKLSDKQKEEKIMGYISTIVNRTKLNEFTKLGILEAIKAAMISDAMGKAHAAELVSNLMKLPKPKQKVPDYVG